MSRLTIRRPDDWHLHLRDGEMLAAVVPYSSQHFARAIIMPNLVPPVVTTNDALAYRDRILKAVPASHDFQPLMTLYLTETTDENDVERGVREGLIVAVKLYPAGATTNSQSGVGRIEKIYPVLERMSQLATPLLLHGEVTDPDVDIFDREAAFIETVLDPLRTRFPDLRIVMEHLTTREGVEYVLSADENLAATITPHHLIINRNALFSGGIRPEYYCLPIAKREAHRQALRGAAISGNTRFFLGTDSAPHPDLAKFTACGCAGIFNAANAMACLAHVFEEEGALERLEGFTSLHGPAFYNMQPNQQRIDLIKEDVPYELPEQIICGSDTITVFDPEFNLFWRVHKKDATNMSEHTP